MTICKLEIRNGKQWTFFKGRMIQRCAESRRILLCNAWRRCRRASFLHTVLPLLWSITLISVSFSILQVSRNKSLSSLCLFPFSFSLLLQLNFFSNSRFLPSFILVWCCCLMEVVVYCFSVIPARHGFQSIYTLSAVHFFTFIEHVESTLESCSW